MSAASGSLPRPGFSHARRATRNIRSTRSRPSAQASPFLFRRGQRPAHAVLAKEAETSAVPDLVTIPDHARREAIMHLSDATEAPITAADVPAPAQHRPFVGQQLVALPAHCAIQKASRVRSRNPIGVAPVTAGNHEIDGVGPAFQRIVQEVLQPEIPHRVPLPEQAALPAGHPAREERVSGRASSTFTTAVMWEARLAVAKSSRQATFSRSSTSSGLSG